MEERRLIGLDWGTSSLRAYLFARDGSVLESLEAPAGIQAIEGGRFRAAFETVCTPWLARAPATPVLACGMIGSRQGWREAPYVATPAGFDELAAGMLSIDEGAGRGFRIVPGVSTRGGDGVRDVMRGEETQVFGALASAGAGDATVVLPGTHSKWVRVRGGRIVAFRTYLTGELYSVLARHSILGRLFPDTGPDTPAGAPPPASSHASAEQAFADGLDRAASDPAGITSLLFSVRAQGLFGEYPAAALPSYLSGLLIGAEVAHARGRLDASPADTEVVLVGARTLVARYAAALERAGMRWRAASGVPAADGLFALARSAGLFA